MKLNSILATSSAAISILTTGHADVLYSNAGPLTEADATPIQGTSLVNTTNDTADWITAGGYDTGTGTTPLYMQVTMNVINNAGETGTGGFYNALALFQASAGHFALGNYWESLNWGGFLSGAGGEPGNYDLTGSPAYAVGTPASFVLKLDQSVSTATIYFNPNLSLTEAAQPADSVTVRNSLGTFDEFDSLNIRSGGPGGSTTFSNIVVRNDSPFAAAVPEPGTTLLGGLAGLLLMRRRR